MNPMKKFSLFFALMLISTSLSANDLCAKYENSPRYVKALTTVAEFQKLSLEDFCHHPLVLDIEVQPSRIINVKGEVIPHVRVEQHKNYGSCFYMVNELDYSISNAECYSGM